MGNLSFVLAMIDNVHFLSDFSSSDSDPVQSSVAPPLEDKGTGCKGVVPVEGLKSISEPALAFTICWGFGVAAGKRTCAGDEPRDSDDGEALECISLGGELEDKPCRRASRRALSFSACCTSLRILGSIESNGIVSDM